MMKRPTSSSTTVAIPIESEDSWQDPERNDPWAQGDYEPVLHTTDWSDSAGNSDPFANEYEPGI